MLLRMKIRILPTHAS